MKPKGTLIYLIVFFSILLNVILLTTSTQTQIQELEKQIEQLQEKNEQLQEHNDNLQQMNGVQQEYIKQYQELLKTGNVEFNPKLKG